MSVTESRDDSRDGFKKSVLLFLVSSLSALLFTEAGFHFVGEVGFFISVVLFFIPIIIALRRYNELF